MRIGDPFQEDRLEIEVCCPHVCGGGARCLADQASKLGVTMSLSNS
jgi:hypothetical protein